MYEDNRIIKVRNELVWEIDSVKVFKVNCIQNDLRMIVADFDEFFVTNEISTLRWAQIISICTNSMTVIHIRQTTTFKATKFQPNE